MPAKKLKGKFLNTQGVVDTGGRIEALHKQRAKNVSVHFLVNKIVELSVLKASEDAFFYACKKIKREVLNTQGVVDIGGRIEALHKQRAKNVSVHFLVNKIVELSVLKASWDEFLFLILF